MDGKYAKLYGVYLRGIYKWLIYEWRIFHVNHSPAKIIK